MGDNYVKKAIIIILCFAISVIVMSVATDMMKAGNTYLIRGIAGFCFTWLMLDLAAWLNNR